jgi:hypothetical protein
MQAMQTIAVTTVIEITRGKNTNMRLSGSKSSPKQYATQSLENAGNGKGGATTHHPVHHHNSKKRF